MSTSFVLSPRSRLHGARRSRWRVSTVLVLVVPLALGAACGSSPSEPPVVMLDNPDAAVAGDEQIAAAPVDHDVCDLLDDPEVAVEPARWRDYLPALDVVLPADDALRAAVAELHGDQNVTPTRLTTMDVVWDALEPHCAPDAEREQCRSLVMLALADPLGLGARGGDPVEVEAAFDLAIDNLQALRDGTDDEDLQHAVDAHLRVTTGGRRAFEGAGWGPDGLAAMEDIQADIVLLGSPEVTEPLFALESRCGFHQTGS